MRSHTLSPVANAGTSRPVPVSPPQRRRHRAGPRPVGPGQEIRHLGRLARVGVGRIGEAVHQRIGCEPQHGNRIGERRQAQRAQDAVGRRRGDDGRRGKREQLGKIEMALLARPPRQATAAPRPPAPAGRPGIRHGTRDAARPSAARARLPPPATPPPAPAPPPARPPRPAPQPQCRPLRCRQFSRPIAPEYPPCPASREPWRMPTRPVKPWRFSFSHASGRRCPIGRMRAADHPLGHIDRRTRKLRPFAPARPGRRKGGRR
jgi:hypothetical protein